ncbi:MAG: PD40 domain-containing protein [Candidatus Eremiobacteraeota bacterium]|nr:PD40 domain-containing protein [Candidatus Eremiobacteraeota bacterium]
MRSLRLVLGVLATAFVSHASGLAATAPARCTLDVATSTTIDRKPFLSGGYGMRWNAAGKRLAFMQPGSGGYYRIFTMRPDGSDRKALNPPPHSADKHQGAAYWSPSGRYILFVAEKHDWSGRRLFGIPDYEALPGFGRHDDLWLSAADGSRSWQLTDDANTADQGVLIPVFAPNGKRIAWSARQPGGTYVLKVADFVDGPQPHLKNIQSFRPGGAAYYEPGSFTSDSRSLTYSSDQDTHSFWHSQIYRLDLASGKSVRVTPGNDYNEHPPVVDTPSGDWIVYMSSKGVDRYPGHLLLGTDWYAVKANGNDVKRLTTMNVNRAGNQENTGSMQVAGTIAIGPSGTFMLGDVQDSLVRQTGSVRLVRFTCGP